MTELGVKLKSVWLHARYCLSKRQNCYKAAIYSIFSKYAHLHIFMAPKGDGWVIVITIMLSYSPSSGSFTELLPDSHSQTGMAIMMTNLTECCDTQVRQTQYHKLSHTVIVSGVGPWKSGQSPSQIWASSWHYLWTTLSTSSKLSPT